MSNLKKNLSLTLVDVKLVSRIRFSIAFIFNCIIYSKTLLHVAESGTPPSFLNAQKLSVWWGEVGWVGGVCGCNTDSYSIINVWLYNYKDNIKYC